MEHPRINQNTWTKEEDTALVGLARKYNKRHWEKVAEELGVIILLRIPSINV